MLVNCTLSPEQVKCIERLSEWHFSILRAGSAICKQIVQLVEQI